MPHKNLFFSRGERRDFAFESTVKDCDPESMDEFSFVQPLSFRWPAKSARQALATVVPVFLPFRGCPVRCVFCAQDAQTGQSLRVSSTDSDCKRDLGNLDGVLAAARAVLEHHFEQLGEKAGKSIELAFYGGTFTAMPEKDLAMCLDFAARALDMGWIGSFRCSTRPDRVNAAVLGRLRAAGCTTVELGVQSFADAALAASRRGYSGAVAQEACAIVRQAGLRLGVQLLPGMPGHAFAHFTADVATGLAAGADMLRFYPCLVLEGTELASLWRQGNYTPWSLEDTLSVLARGWLLAAEAGVPVIRMGLAPEPELKQAVLAGPVDPALGNRVMGYALLHAVSCALEVMGQKRPKVFDLQLPHAVRGCLWGARGELRVKWAAMGLRRVLFSDHAAPALNFDPSVSPL